MKITIAVAAAILIGVTSAAAKPAIPEETAVLCTDRTADLADLWAEQIATHIFARISVRLEWHTAPACPQNAVRIRFSYKTAPGLHPGALAYAVCGDTQIVLFYDRATGVGEKSMVPFVLGHVLAHEITHILQGVARHSEEGLMKAHWTLDDYDQMRREPLTFTEEDINLIHQGFGKRIRPDQRNADSTGD